MRTFLIHTQKPFQIMKNENLENIALRWMRDEGLTYSEARKLALEEIDFYTEEKPSWKGPDDRVQEYI
jgi:hypothetical protein